MARRRYTSEREYESGRGYESGRRSSRFYGHRRERRSEERRIELMTYLALVVLFVVTFMFQGQQTLSPAWISVLGGGILVGSAIYQTQRRWRVNPATWLGGAIMLVAGIFALQPGNTLPFGNMLPILVFIGVLVAGFITGDL